MSQNQRPPEAFRTPDMFEAGIGKVCVSRFKSGGRVESGIFLVDLFCLGVKDAMFHQSATLTEYEELLDDLFNEGRIEMQPAEARKFVEQAVAYAAGLGIAPGADYKKGCRVFGGIKAEDWPGDFTFGKDGKPFFIAGPDETPAHSNKIQTLLEAHCGPGNYDFLVPSELIDAESEYIEEDETDETSEMEKIAVEWLKSHPGEDSVDDMPGMPKMSDRLAKVAEPLLREVSILEVQKTILSMAELAWNYPLLPPDTQPQFWEEMKEFGPEAIEILELLIARRQELFPNDRRLIDEVEASDVGGKLTIRTRSKISIPEDL